MAVGHRVGLAGQLRLVEVLDVVDGAVEQVEDVECQRGVSRQLVGDAQVGRQRRGRAHAVVLHQRACTQVAPLQAGRPGPAALCGDGHRRHLVDAVGDAVARRVGVGEAGMGPGQVGVDQQPRQGGPAVVPFHPAPAARPVGLGGAGVADVDQFRVEVEPPQRQ